MFIQRMLKAFAKKILLLVPVKNIILFESNPDFEDNTYWFFKYCVEEKHIQEQYQLVWMIADMNKKRSELCRAKIICVNDHPKTLIDKIKRAYYVYAAKIIIDCNRAIPKVRNQQIRAHLGHGMAIKSIDKYLNSIGKCDMFLIMAEGFRDYYRKFFPDEVIKSFGLPRNVILQKTIKTNANKLILWMPTFRQHILGHIKEKNIFPLGLPVIKSVSDLQTLNQYCLEHNIQLLIRPHPAQDLSFFNIKDMNSILIANDDYLRDNGITLYELVAKSDALITDYSSIYYDYLLTKGQIGLTLEDANEYSKTWPLLVDDIRNDLAGVKIDTIADLLSFIQDVNNENDREKSTRDMLVSSLGIKPLNSNELIFDYLFHDINNNKIE